MNIFKPTTYLIFFIANILLYFFYDFGKAHFMNDNLFGFYPVFGFFACLALIIIAKVLAYFLERNEKYYDS